MSRKYIVPERLIPSELDISDPVQKEELDCHVEKYRFASIFVEGKKVLDVACGSGYGSEILFKEGKAESVLGVDIDENIIEVAKKEYGREGIHFKSSSFDMINQAEKFNTIVSINTLEYMRNPAYFLSSIRSLLSQSGDLIISVHTTPTTDFNPFILHDISRRRFYKLLKKAGFQVDTEFRQTKEYRIGSAVDLIKKKKAQDDSHHKPRSIIQYYLSHPVKAARRIMSLVKDGFTVKTLTVRAKPLSR